MSGDHQFYNAPETCVQEHISSLTRLNPSLKQLGALPCVVQANLDRTKVALICGGGSGHEPAHAGYVGRGMLSGAVAGGVFASPSAATVLQLIKAVTGEAGCLVIIKNYTGDCLNFGIAVEKARKSGLKVEMVICADDTTLLDKDTIAGPRGLCGVLFIQKIAGAYAAQGATLDSVYKIAQLVCKNIGTAGVALRACVPPGRTPSFTLPPATMEFGVGIHGEAGVLRCASIDCKSTVAKLFEYLADPRGLNLKSGDDVVVMVNNLGGTSELEMSVVVNEVIAWLAAHQVICYRIYSGVFMTSLGMHGISLSVLRLDSEGNMLEQLKYPTTAVSWKSGQDLSEPIDSVVQWSPTTSHRDTKPSNTDTRMVKILEAVCEDLRAKVAELDELDRVSGDGDCGSTISALLLALRSEIPTLDYSSLSTILAHLAEIIEKHMGGTSGALYTIGLTAAANRIKECEEEKCADNSSPLCQATCGLEAAVAAISRYGKAKEGDCTMLDVLCPVLRVMQFNAAGNTSSLTAMCSQSADTGVLKTKKLAARAGRASYIGTVKTSESADPGAVAAATWIKSVCRVLYQEQLNK